MIISHRKRFIFFACGKAGTTSIEKILQKYHDDEALTKKIELKLSDLRIRFSKPFNPKHARPALVKQIAGEDIWQLNVTHHKHYRELYTEPAKELVSGYCRDDIELLGYQF